MEINHVGYQSEKQADTQSCVSDWEVTSVDRWNTKSSRGTRSVSSSMQNYLDSYSVENQSIQSQPIEHLDDTESRSRKLSGDSDQRFKENRKLSLTQSVVEESEQKEPEKDQKEEEALIDFGYGESDDNSQQNINEELENQQASGNVENADQFENTSSSSVVKNKESDQDSETVNTDS